MDELQSEFGPPSQPRRTLALLFSDLSDSTVLASFGEPEDYLEILRYLRSHCLAIVPKHGGTIIDFSGDGFLAMFGYPDSTESDGRRAIEAALEMHDVMRRSPFRSPNPAAPTLALHSGIHSGLVLVIANDLYPGRYVVVGEAPNLAAKLSDAAGRDEILVSATTLGGESHFFELSPRARLTLSGKSEPVQTYRVLGLSPASTRYEARARRGLTPFVGRDTATRVLQSNLRAARAGSVRIVYIVASPGVGKTRLAQEFLRSSDAVDCEVCQGYCESTLTAEPLQPILQMLRAMQVERTIPDDGSHHAVGDRTIGDIRDLFAARAATHPLILFIDDWHWVDDATRQALISIRGLSGVPILIVVASRSVLPVDPGAQDADVVDLAPFEEDEAARTIRTLRPDLDPFVVRHIQQLSGGNPLFIEELCHFASPGSLSGSERSADSSLAWLGTLIESRVNQLPDEQADLVRAAAVIGKVVPGWLLEQVCECSLHDERVRDLASRDLIFPGEIPGTLRFKHGVTRDVVYKLVGRRQRRQMHLRIGQLLEREAASGAHEEMLEALAYHYDAGGDAPRATRYAALAGDKALAAAALDRARSHYGVALGHLAALPASDETARQFSDLAQRMGLACVYDPTRQHLDIFTRAVEIARGHTDEAAIARAEYWLGYIHYALGELPAAIHHCELAQAHCSSAVADARTTGTSATLELEALGVQVLSTLGQARAAAGDYDGVLDQLDAAAQIKRRHRSGAGPAVGLAYTLACKGGVLADYGRFDAADACFAEALDVVSGRSSPVEASVLAWQSAVYLWRGQWTRAIEIAARVQTIAEHIESLYVLSMAEAIMGYAHWILNRDADAIDVMIRATSWLEARDKRLYISMNHGWIADAMVDAGRYAEARTYAAGALRRARLRDPFGEAMAYRALARMADPGEGRGSPRDYLDKALASARRRSSAHEEAVTLLHLGSYEARAGHQARANTLRDQASQAFRTMDMRWHEAELRRQLTF